MKKSKFFFVFALCAALLYAVSVNAEGEGNSSTPVVREDYRAVTREDGTVAGLQKSTTAMSYTVTKHEELPEVEVVGIRPPPPKRAIPLIDVDDKKQPMELPTLNVPGPEIDTSEKPKETPKAEPLKKEKAPKEQKEPKKVEKDKSDYTYSKETKELRDKADAAKENEKKFSNRLLTGTTMAATGLAGMNLAQGLSNQHVDNEGAAEMLRYRNTFRCGYGSRKDVGYAAMGETPGISPKHEELLAEYGILTASLKDSKRKLDMPRGIEEKELIDVTSDYKNHGPIFGTEELAADNIRGDTAESRKDANKKQVTIAAVVGGVAIAGAVTANVLMNHKKDKNSSISDLAQKALNPNNKSEDKTESSDKKVELIKNDLQDYFEKDDFAGLNAFVVDLIEKEKDIKPEPKKKAIAIMKTLKEAPKEQEGCIILGCLDGKQAKSIVCNGKKDDFEVGASITFECKKSENKDTGECTEEMMEGLRKQIATEAGGLDSEFQKLVKENPDKIDEHIADYRGSFTALENDWKTSPCADRDDVKKEIEENREFMEYAISQAKGTDEEKEVILCLETGGVWPKGAAACDCDPKNLGNRHYDENEKKCITDIKPEKMTNEEKCNSNNGIFAGSASEESCVFGGNKSSNGASFNKEGSCKPKCDSIDAKDGYEHLPNAGDVSNCICYWKGAPKE